MIHQLRYHLLRLRNAWLQRAGVHVPREWRQQEWVAEMKLDRRWRKMFDRAEGKL